MSDSTSPVTRRSFMEMTTAAAAATMFPSGVHTQSATSIKVGVIGTGGRGTGAIANMLMSAEGVEISALGDLSPDRIEQSRITLDKQAAEDRDFGARYKTGFKVAGDKVYTGFDAYKKVIASDVDMIILVDAARLPSTAPRRRRRRRQAHLHGEAGRHRFSRHPLGARDLRRSPQEEARHRRRHPAPSPGRVHRDDQAHPQRRHRRCRERPGLLEPGRAVEQRPAAELVRHRMADPQLAVLHLAVGRPHRRAARPQHRRRELGDEGASGEGHRHGRAPAAHRPEIRPHLRSLRRRLRVPERRARDEHVPADRGHHNRIGENFIGTKGSSDARARSRAPHRGPISGRNGR